MAYTRPPYSGPGSIDSARELHRSSWESNYSSNTLRSNPPPTIRSSNSSLPPSDAMDPESSDSDVSVTPVDNYRYGSPPAVPAPLPLQPSKHALEASDAVQSRLRDLSRVEDHNIKKQERLLAKRRRKDDKIARKREIQDRKIKAIMDARERRDARISIRRAREDAAFRGVDDQLEEEEMSLRRRLRRLKRGLPLDESPPPGRSMSSASMSPPGPSFSTIPPPAKRHQLGPPGHQDETQPHRPPVTSQSSLPPPQNGPPAPPYSFYQSNHQPYSVPYHNSTAYGGAPNTAASATSSRPGPLSSNTPNDRPSFGMNGRPASPLGRPSQTSAPTHTPSPATSAPPRQISSSYDTRPPPSTSGFASINAPPTSGFAAINPKATGTTPVSQPGQAQPAGESRTTPVAARVGQPAVHEYRTYGEETPAETAARVTASLAAKANRTPSTTHPYQMSEAFANRHHHCERVDSLNRGIWTSHGPMGTSEAPTGPPVEMYLRCNHDDCQRIDWRTVHGLQCHIVKNHEQPKGTIGSLEKALDKYGVPVSEVEAYEREHGEGTAGTMADPKNLKIKNKTREASASRGPIRKSTPGSYGIDPTARPAGYKPSPSSTHDSPTVASSTGLSPSVSTPVGGYPPHSTAYSGRDSSVKGSSRVSTPSATNRFESVRSGWTSAGGSLPRPPSHGNELSKLQGDAVMRDAPTIVQKSPKAQVSENRPSWRTWPESPRTQSSTPSAPGPSKAVGIPESPKSILNESFPKPAKDESTGPSTKLAEIPPPPSTQTQVMDEQVKKVEEKPENADDAFSNPAVPDSQTTNTRNISIVEEHRTVQSTSDIAGMVNGEKADTEKVPVKSGAEDISTEPKKDQVTEQENGTEAMEIDSKDTSAVTTPAIGRRSTMQSPVITTKPLNTPGSTKRGSRRSSTARKPSSADGEAENAGSTVTAAVSKDAEKYVNKEEDDGDSITVASSTTTNNTRKEDGLREREPAKTQPRRNTAGRFTRNSRAG